MKMGIQGVPGSFCEEAANLVFKDKSVDYVYLKNSLNVCEAVFLGRVDRGIIATENSIGGRVIESDVALEKYPLKIIDTIVMPIRQCLMAKTTIALVNVTEVHSHVQALAQSKNFIDANLPQAKCIPEEDTALCARYLQEGRWSATAAMIGNAACVEIYGLQLLRANVHSTDDNRTTFVILAIK
jgi:prephenate dehydratase